MIIAFKVLKVILRHHQHHLLITEGGSGGDEGAGGEAAHAAQADAVDAGKFLGLGVLQEAIIAVLVAFDVLILILLFIFLLLFFLLFLLVAGKVVLQAEVRGKDLSVDEAKQLKDGRRLEVAVGSGQGVEVVHADHQVVQLLVLGAQVPGSRGDGSVSGGSGQTGHLADDALPQVGNQVLKEVLLFLGSCTFLISIFLFLIITAFIFFIFLIGQLSEQEARLAFNLLEDGLALQRLEDVLEVAIDGGSG